MIQEQLQNELFSLASKHFLTHLNTLEEKKQADMFLTLYDLHRQAGTVETHLTAKTGEAHHILGNLQQAAGFYQQMLKKLPVASLSEEEEQAVFTFAPVVWTTRHEYFALNDVCVVHHPERPLIGYHLFWEDDYDFPDDGEPSDHEVIWIGYHPAAMTLTRIVTLFHGYPLSTPEALEVAAASGGKPGIRIEWGKHGPLLKGWETIRVSSGHSSLYEWMYNTFLHVKHGGRQASHPLKADWLDGFKGSFEEYLDFSVPVDTASYLSSSRMIRHEWANAVMQQYMLRYNFHPKRNWPEFYL